MSKVHLVKKPSSALGKARQRVLHSSGDHPKSNQSSRSSLEKDDIDEGYPEPKPPSPSKSRTFSSTDFSQIEKHVQQTPVKAAESYDTLLEYLCKHLESDTAKVRAIYCWIVRQRLPLLDNEDDIPPPDCPIGYLYLVSERKGSYAQLFCTMCRFVGIPCVVIHGLAKGVTYDVGDCMTQKKHRNSWNAVYVEKNWRFVHPYWASMAAQGYTSGKWTSVDCSEFHKDEGQGGSRSYIVHSLVNDFYFFTDPGVFINKCLPNNDKWQLLPVTISKTHFEELPFLQPTFYHLKLSLVEKETKCVIHCQGKFVLKIQMPQENFRRLLFSYTLFRLRNPEDEGEYDYFRLERYTLQYCLKDVAIFEIRFPPVVTGEYKLQIKCIDTEKSLPSDWICDFKIVCEKGMTRSIPLPIVPRIGWGFNPELEKHNVKVLSHKDGMFSLDKGQLDFKFRFPENSDVHADLLKNSHSKTDFAENLKIERKGKEVTVTVTPSEPGEFALQVFCRDKGNLNYVNICNYLLYRTLLVESASQVAAREKLADAIGKGDSEEISNAIKEFMEKGVEDTGELEDAKRTFLKIKCEKELNEAMESKDLDKLENILKNVSDTYLKRALGKEIEKAERKRSHLRKLKRFRTAVLEMDAKTISELRSYQKPTKPIHGVMVATYLLLGTKEEYVEKWSGVQSMIGKKGKLGLKRRVASFNSDNVSEESYNRAKKILSKYDLSSIQIASAGAATFYQWATNVINDIEQEKT